MSGEIFISYRREESGWVAGRLLDRLQRDFGTEKIFMDIDAKAIPLGANFKQVIERKVAECDVLIAVIGKNWLSTSDDNGERRLDNPEDFVRLEIGTALRREICVIPVLVDGVKMPRLRDLPEDLRSLVWLSALSIMAGTNFDVDCQRLAGAIKAELDKAADKQQERLAAEQRARGQIFISYRREESQRSAESLRDRLCQDFAREQILMDLDVVAQDPDYVKAIEKTVAECDLLIAVIGKNWLTSKDDHGDRRLDNPEDFVRMEIGTALKRKIRVIPVLVDSASMPRPVDLPDDLKPLVRRNALRITDTSFEGDCQRLVSAIRQVLEKASAEEKERLAAEQREKERLVAEQREKERLEAEQREKERLETEQREKERLDADQREKERLAAEQREKEGLWAKEAEQRHREEKEPPQTWIRKIDKLSWLPFATAVLIRLCIFVLGAGWSVLQYPPFWLITALPCFVTASSFFHYPKRRMLEVGASVVPAVILVSLYWNYFAGMLQSVFDGVGGVIPILQLLEITLLAIGAAIKIWLLLHSRTNKIGAIGKTS